MEAGSNTKSIKGQNTLRSIEFFLFLSYNFLFWFDIRTNEDTLIHSSTLGIVNSNLFGYRFLFSRLYNPGSLQSPKESGFFIYFFQNGFSQVMADASKAKKTAFIGLVKNQPGRDRLSLFKSLSLQNDLIEISGPVSAEAPSLQLKLPVMSASNSCMSNQILCL